MRHQTADTLYLSHVKFKLDKGLKPCSPYHRYIDEKYTSWLIVPSYHWRTTYFLIALPVIHPVSIYFCSIVSFYQDHFCLAFPSNILDTATPAYKAVSLASDRHSCTATGCV